MTSLTAQSRRMKFCPKRAASLQLARALPNPALSVRRRQVMCRAEQAAAAAHFRVRVVCHLWSQRRYDTVFSTGARYAWCCSSSRAGQAPKSHLINLGMTAPARVGSWSQRKTSLLFMEVPTQVPSVWWRLVQWRTIDTEFDSSQQPGSRLFDGERIA